MRTEQQIDKIIKKCNESKNSLILYTIVETKLAKIFQPKPKIQCTLFWYFRKFDIKFFKIAKQKAIHKPSAQHVLDDDYYKRIEAIQFTMSHDDGKKLMT